MFDYVVVGAGLIGSAAARYLGERQQNVAVIGPDEPQDWQTHQGVFASHYDQGRITRILDEDLVWGTLAKRSIAEYPSIEQKSGLKFYFPATGLQVGRRPTQPHDFIAKTEAVGQKLEATFERYEAEALKAVQPLFNFAADMVGLLETEPAGYIHPRALVQAQLSLARQQGVSIIRETVVSVEKNDGGILLRSTAGQSYQAAKVLVAAGAYTNTLLETKLDMTPKTRTIILAELPPSEAARLAKLPTLIYEPALYPELLDIYLLPPVKYPDGKTYLKIGESTTSPPIASSVEALRDWFHTDGNPEHAAALKTTLYAIIPNLKVNAILSKPCVTTTTAAKYPYIDVLEPGRLFVAAGGCGAAAKSSNEIGRLAAGLVENEAWTDALDEGLFKARYI